jgi:hypothetical protein
MIFGLEHVELGPAYERGRDPIGCVRVRRWPFDVECRKCGEPRKQQLTQRTNQGGETWEIQTCQQCQCPQASLRAL